MNQWTYINEKFVYESDASLHASDLAIQRGYGIFDFLKTINNHPIFLKEHLQRFNYSAEQMHLPVQQTTEELSAIIHELIERNKIGTSGIRLTLTGGYSPDGYNIASPNLIITQQPVSLPSTAAFENGIRLTSFEHLRTLPQIKSLNYLMAVWLQPYLKKQGTDDVLYHMNGEISECPRANFFIVKNGVLITPNTNILLGITRQKVISLANGHYKVEERPVTLDELKDCQEAFITSTTRQLMPVASVDGILINNGTPGPVTRELLTALTALQVPQVSVNG